MSDEQRKRSAYWASLNPWGANSSKGDVQMYFNAPFASGRPGETAGFDKTAYIQNLVCESDAVAVVDITSHASQLAENSDYVFTDYQLNLIDVLKSNSKPKIKSGETVTLTEVGGAVSVDGRKIYFDISRNYPLVRGNRYILFLDYLEQVKAYRLSSFRGIFRVGELNVKASFYSSTNDVGELKTISSLIRVVSQNCQNTSVKQTR